MKIRLQNTAGRHLGTYEVASTDPDQRRLEALYQLASEGGYSDLRVAEEKRFMCPDRIVSIEEAEE